MRDNKVQVAVLGYPIGNIPDVSRTLSYFVTTHDAENYHADRELMGWADEMDRTLDPAARKAIGRKIFDALTERAYVMPVAPRPVPMVHRDTITVETSRYVTMGFHPGALNWK
jgi:hypothetical protein